MKTVGPNSLAQIIKKHPWSSLRDGLILSSLMVFAVLLAMQYDIFAFFSALADPQRGISPPEAVLLLILLAASIYAFVARRLSEARWDDMYHHELEREMRELRVLATQDPLTGLPNRRALISALTAAIAEPVGGGTRHVFFLLDLNDFKRVNDVHGHAVGDHVLQVVVERFKAAARPTDLLARLGGDEFAVLSYNVDREAAHAIGTRFIVTLEGEIRVEGCGHDVGVSVGAALIPDDGATAHEILRNADLAMYRAKGQERSSLAFFDPGEDAPGSAHKAIG